MDRVRSAPSVRLSCRHRSGEVVSIMAVGLNRHETDIADNCSIFGVVAVVSLFEQSLLRGLGDIERHDGRGSLREGLSCSFLEVVRIEVDVWSGRINFDIARRVRRSPPPTRPASSHDYPAAASILLNILLQSETICSDISNALRYHLCLLFLRQAPSQDSEPVDPRVRQSLGQHDIEPHTVFDYFPTVASSTQIQSI